jgi:hypothetical protein
MTDAPEPEDKLDATTAMAGVVNGPKDVTLDWRQVDWRAAEESVRRLRQRIFTASRAGGPSEGPQSAKLMLPSRSNTLLSMRRVTERNSVLTAGVDGEVVLTPEAKMRLVERVQRSTEPFMAGPVRRVYTPKRGNGAKRRPVTESAPARTIASGRGPLGRSRLHRRLFASVPLAGSALPPAAESSHAGVRRSRGSGCPFAAAAQGVVDVKIVDASRDERQPS